MRQFIGTKIVEAEPAIRQTVKEPCGEPGYRVRYPDGYESWSPKEVFEAAYRPTDGGMDFGMALHALRRGQCIARTGWNGKGMWLALIEPGNAHFSKGGARLPMRPCIGMRTATCDMQPGWLASQADMLADDWHVVSNPT